MKSLKLLAATLAFSTAFGGAAFAQTNLTMWYHGAGSTVERDLINGIITDFNGSQTDWKVSLQEFPQAAYNDSVVAAAVAGNLPDIIDVDGPVMPNWAWAGYMQPLQLSEGALNGFLPGAIGKYNDQVYSVGLWDAAVAMYARKSTLEKFNIRIPTLEQPWTGEEFNGILETLKASGEFDYPLNLGMADQGEWYPYAFAPFLWSFGGDLVDRTSYETAEGALNGDAAVAFGEWWQSLFTNNYVPGTSQDMASHETGFIDGDYALQWNGNWVAVKTLEALGDDVLFLPAPDFGNGPKIGGASWQFGVSATSAHPDGASAFIEFALQPKYLAAFSDGIGLIPATAEAAAFTKNYAPGGALESFYALSEKQAMLRPVTPGYVFEALEFRKALSDIANGADVVDALDAATDAINADIARNNNYAAAQ
ncbi:extracellular solute-binding protein [Devosia sp. BK]|uniref:sugar ABC transporter substrate-binding protein n=1 Tax=Devosia sp. BK TaxID=2871706 RepID=UPI002939B9C8|nr:extracellular solute-binding protein [Devosia sp. BK]MDV3253087.1 extracellular solute-binding protein [Devosia sp. BK]